MKQYQQGQQWYPVPGEVNIFDRNALKVCLVGTDTLRGNAVHPLTRDVISTPSPHAIDGVAHETRYIIHPYYVANEEATQLGMCEEVNQLAGQLRARLHQIQVLQNVQRDPVEERHLFSASRV